MRGDEKAMKMKPFILLVLIWTFCFSGAVAQEARNLTNDCIISSPNKETDSVHDGAYTSFWRSRTSEKPYLEFQTPEGEKAQYLYICFAEMPKLTANGKPMPRERRIMFTL